MKKYSCNEDFFNSPNILNCYYAGLIAADGHIYNKQRGQAIVVLTSGDKEVIESFKKDIQYNGQIELALPKKDSHSISYKIRIRSNKLCNALEKGWNITERKSFTLQPPYLVNKNMRLSYIKGYMDGDGGIYRHPNLRLFFCGASKDMLDWIKETLNVNNTISFSRNLYSLKIHGKNASNILSEFYKLETPCIIRKKKVFDGV